MNQLRLGASSHAYLGTSGLAIRLGANLFAPALWEQICAWFNGSPTLTWLLAPFQAMNAAESTPGSPRWKVVAVDVLSWLLFLATVPTNHPLVALWQAVDWAAINRICAPCYQNGERGQRAWAPAQMVALLILFFVLPLASETALVQTVAIVPLYRWFCGFGLFSPLPDHSTLYTFRKRIGGERFEAILTWVVHQCLQRKLIGNDLAFFDMMAVAASAHVWTPFERAVLLTQALIRYLELAEQGQTPAGPVPEALRRLAAEMAIEVLESKSLQENPRASLQVLKSLERWTQRRQAAKGQALWELAIEEAVQAVLSEEHALSSRPSTAPQALPDKLKKVAQVLKAHLPHARGDLDACIGHVTTTVLQCGYWLGFLVDRLHSVITAVRVVPLNVPQNTQMTPALDTHKERVGAYPKAVAADSAQDYYPVHHDLDQRQIEGHIASREHRGVGGGLSSEHFTWNVAGQMVCPEGHVMQAGNRRKDGLIPYKATGNCALCQRKAACLTKGQQPDGPRRICLDPVAHQRWLQNREHTGTAAYKEAQRQRFASEGLFGLARRLHGADDMPYRSTTMNLTAGILIGVVMNLAVMAKCQGRADI
jgi:transposase